MTSSRSPRYPASILATCCIPWKEDFTFDSDRFRREVRMILQHLTKHVYIFGTAREGYGVTDRQFAEICAVFRQETAASDVRATVGIISLSLGTIVERILSARKLGFGRFQISLPSWGPLSDSELAAFFEETCGRFPDCEFLHYNLGRAKRLVTPEEYAVLAQRHPNLVGTKNSSGRNLSHWSYRRAVAASSWPRCRQPVHRRIRRGGIDPYPGRAGGARDSSLPGVTLARGLAAEAAQRYISQR